MTAHADGISPPNPLSIVFEARTALDIARMTGPLLKAQLLPRKARRGSPIMVVPGFGSIDLHTKPLRHYLSRKGYQVEGWGLGVNLAGANLEYDVSEVSEGWNLPSDYDYNGETDVPHLCDRLAERVQKRHQVLEQPITLIGWSLGGLLAREVARDLPDVVDKVITLGSPAVGGPKYTAVAPVFRKRGADVDWIAKESLKRDERPIQQPVTSIFSKSDAIVSWRATEDNVSDNFTHVEVNSAHFGLGFNPSVWRRVLEALEQD